MVALADLSEAGCRPRGAAQVTAVEDDIGVEGEVTSKADNGGQLLPVTTHLMNDANSFTPKLSSCTKQEQNGISKAMDRSKASLRPRSA